ncbi:MAG: metal ABC transporter permease [Planctomycetota bacterium]|jgi:zinc transport system permease protein
MLEALDFPFFQRALVAGLLASLACGVMGSYVVVKRIASISGGLAHAAFGGVGLGYLLGFEPIFGALGFALLSGIGIGITYRRLGEGLDTLVAMVWSVGMAMGVLFVALSPGYAPDLMTYLFGSILFVGMEYVLAVLLLDLVIVLVVWALFRKLEALIFDEEYAEVAGVRVGPHFLLLLALTSLAVVTLIRIVGVILVIALLTIPAVIARRWSSSLLRMMVGATLIGAACTAAGLFLAYGLGSGLDVDVPTGPLIVLLAASVYGVSEAAHLVRTRGRG